MTAPSVKPQDAAAAQREKRLTVASRVVEDRVELRFRDTGCGMTREQLERAFEPLHSTKSFGIGLGLPIVRRTMEQHGGTIEIESEPGVGTTVILRLPLTATPGTEASPAQEEVER